MLSFTAGDKSARSGKLKHEVIKAVNVLIEDIDTCHEQIAEQAVEHIHHKSLQLTLIFIFSIKFLHMVKYMRSHCFSSEVNIVSDLAECFRNLIHHWWTCMLSYYWMQDYIISEHSQLTSTNYELVWCSRTNKQCIRYYSATLDQSKINRPTALSKSTPKENLQRGMLIPWFLSHLLIFFHCPFMSCSS